MLARLRAAGPADAADIFRLIVDLATYEREPDAVVVTVDELRAQLAAERPPFECLLAEDDDGAVVGFALYFHNYSTWRGRPGLYLEDLFVEPSRRGRGIGKQLLVRLAQLAVERGCARMEWAVLDWNTPAIGFYERLGARAVSEWTIFRLTGQELLNLAQST
ncbi:GNAT family N-acetyltransferase [Nannocystis pusilla]|uniref:GNAT family N-acetyltransferase n=1 Tax=Nannocystis pusilla TaxID=889268 RepID=A0ABS7U1Y1_9BACT|nr:GNAT family N-acetyltransferase [Nannocystis pusilla]MBZ5714533.1 GNAT family N-acetyltransferase [Nannocystis pusilla]